MLKCQFNDFELNCSQIMLVHRPSETPRLTIYPIGEGEENNDALFVNAVKHFKQLKAEDGILVVEDKETFTYTGYILEKAVFEYLLVGTYKWNEIAVVNLDKSTNNTTFNYKLNKF